MSSITLTHEMAEIKQRFTQAAAKRANARQREREADEEEARSHLRLNNLEIALQSIQRDTERRLKRPRSHSERETESAAGRQRKERHDKRRMLPPPNPLGTTEQTDDAPRRQRRSRADEPTGETRSLLQTLREQLVSNIDADSESTGLELEAEHWQRKEAAAARRYTQALELRAQLAEEAVGQHQDGSHPDEQRLRAWTRHEQHAEL